MAGLARHQDSVRAKRQALRKTLASFRANGDLPSALGNPLSAPPGIRVITAGGTLQSAGVAGCPGPSHPCLWQLIGLD